MKTPITLAKMKYHFHYNAWRYVLLVALSIFGWNIIYTTTSYRPPENKKINFYISSSGTEASQLDTYMTSLLETTFTDMEEMTAVVMASNDGSDPYTTMQLSTYIMAGEGDVYMLSVDDFKSYSQSGGMLPLEGHVESGAIDPMDSDLTVGYQTFIDGNETHLYGIPTDKLFGMMEQFGTDNRGMVLCIMARSGNEENAAKFINQLFIDMKQDPPEWLDNYDLYVESQATDQP